MAVARAGRLTGEDRRGLILLFWMHVRPSSRLKISAPSTADAA
ncbi:hypothetical protein [Streptomyces sp. BA2]|nr:hypothetical protein [Streptomyces sp. BA2]